MVGSFVGFILVLPFGSQDSMSSGTFDGKFVIDKLTGSNYGVWSMKLKMMLMKDDLWGLIDGPKSHQLRQQQHTLGDLLRQQLRLV